MRRTKRLLVALIAVVMLASIAPVAYAVDETYGKVTISTNGQTVVFDEAYTKDPVTVKTTSDGEVFTSATLTPLVIKPNSHMTVTGGEDDTLEVAVYLNSHNEDFIVPSALGGCKGTTGSVSQILDYDWTNVNSEKNQEKAYFLVTANQNWDTFYWLQAGDESTNSNAATEQETVTTPSKPVEQPKPSTPSTSTGNYSNSYTDVQPGAWYYDAIMTMTENGVLNGYGNGKFGPDDIITDAQLTTIMNRLTKKPRSYQLTTVDWANAKPLTRGDAAIFIVEVLNDGWASVTLSDGLVALAEETGIPYYTDPLMYKGQPYMDARFEHIWFRLFYKEGRRISDVRLSAADFPDSEAILSCADKWATVAQETTLASHERLVEIGVRYICTAWNLGMFSGYDAAGTFGANDPITRAQICQVLYNMGFASEDCILG